MLEKNKNKENKRLIPLRRFAEVGPYGSAYLSNLVQRKSLKAKKIGRNYFTTQEWFNEYLEMHAREGKRPSLETKEAEPTSGEENLKIAAEESAAEGNLQGKEIDRLNKLINVDLLVRAVTDKILSAQGKREIKSPEASKAKELETIRPRAEPTPAKIESKEAELEESSILISALEKIGREEKFTHTWREEIKKEKKKAEREIKNLNFRKNKFKAGLARRLADSAKILKNKFSHNSWQKKLAAASLALLLAAFSFSFFAPNVSASFAAMMDKALITPLEATRAIAIATEKTAKEIGRIAAESQVFKKATQYSSKAVKEI